MKDMICHRKRTISSCRSGGGATCFLTAAPPDARMQWWREAKFGMFIHWGAYAQMAGVWDGKRMDPNGLIGGKKKAAPQE